MSTGPNQPIQAPNFETLAEIATLIAVMDEWGYKTSSSRQGERPAALVFTRLLLIYSEDETKCMSVEETIRVFAHSDTATWAEQRLETRPSLEHKTVVLSVTQPADRLFSDLETNRNQIAAEWRAMFFKE